MHRDLITEILDEAGVEIGLPCKADGTDGIDHMRPHLDMRECDSCNQTEIITVIYDENGVGMVAWAELVHVYRPEILGNALFADEPEHV